MEEIVAEGDTDNSILGRSTDDNVVPDVEEGWNRSEGFQGVSIRASILGYHGSYKRNNIVNYLFMKALQKSLDSL